MFLRSLTLGAVSVALLSTSAIAADLIIPTTPQPIVESAGFSWDGLYAGVQAGGEFHPSSTGGLVGIHAGVNFIVADPILVGIEGTAEYVWHSAASYGEYFINARLGAVVTDSVMVYALAGTGIASSGTSSDNLYQLGGGVEFAVTDSVSVRAQIVGVADYASANFFDAAKATVGISYHF
jgi:outer membrane immunogenic protein